MSQRIHNGAILVREGRLFLLRQGVDAHWQLPGDRLRPEHPDVDEAMDTMLQEIGVSAPAVEEDFIETIYLRDEDGHIVFNIYAPTEWEGEPAADGGTGAGWFTLEELDAIAMDSRVREAVQAMFGIKDRPDDAAQILAALGDAAGIDLSASQPGATTFAEPTPEAPGDRRQAGLDVLRTLRGAKDGQEAFDQMRQSRPGLAEDIVDFAMGEVWNHPALDRKTRSMLVVAMVAAMGRPAALQSHLNGALNHGVTPEQLVQMMRMVAVYAGFPAAVDAWGALDEVLHARGIPMPGRQA